MSSIYQRNQIVRQNREEIEDLRCFLEIGNNILEVINVSIFGVAALSPIEIDIKEICENVLIKIQNKIVSKIDLKLVRKNTNHKGDFVYAFESVFGSIPIDQLKIIPRLAQYQDEISQIEIKDNTLDREFKLKVFEMRDILTRHRGIIGNLEKESAELRSFDARESFNNTVIDYFGESIHSLIKNGNLILESICQNLDRDHLKDHLGFFRLQLGEFIFQSPFAERSFKKPLGYAGDFEMMNIIYRNDYFANDLFGNCMEAAMQLHQEPEAVRNRARFMHNKLCNAISSSNTDIIRILSVASGPAKELEMVINSLDEHAISRCFFYLLDQDVESLKDAQARILKAVGKRRTNANLNLIHLPIKKIITRGLPEMEFDLIYSVGLFDYLSDPVAKSAAKSLFNALTPNGQLIIGNFDICSPNKFGMYSLFDWPLILRSESDLQRLYSFLDENIEVSSEETGINLFCSIRK